MRFFLIFIFSAINFCFSQVIAYGDTTLCEDQAGEISLVLEAEAFNVDLNDSGIYSDDTYGGVIDIGFNFVFYGNTYNQVVLSSNNHLTFDVANANQYSDWTIDAAAPNNFDCPLNSILCPWQDIYPGVNGNGTIQFATTGEAPNRVFIASFCGIPMFSCTDICYTSQIKLFETTNVIETHIAQKVLCSTWNDGAAIHGIQNSTGNIAHIVTGLDGIVRNYPNQWTCEDDAWRFSPDFNDPNNYIIDNINFAPAVAGNDIIWQDSDGNIIGTGSQIEVTPPAPNEGQSVTYTAGASLCGAAGDWCGFEGGIEGDEVIINFIPTVIFTDPTEPSCYLGTNGSIDVEFPSIGNWQYEIINQENNIIIESGSVENSDNIEFTNIESGEYLIYAENEFGCSDTQIIPVGQPDPIEIITQSINPSCFLGSDGSIVVDLPSIENWQYILSDLENNNTVVQSGQVEGDNLVIENLESGEYLVYVENAFGCSDSEQVSITEPEIIEDSFETFDTNCFGSSDGSINITLNGGTSPYTLFIGDLSTGTTVETQSEINAGSTVTFNNLEAGEYWYTGIDQNGCLTEGDEVFFSINEPEELIIESSTNNVTCAQATNGSINIDVSGGNGNYMYSWFGDNGYLSNEQNPTNLAAGTYTVTVTDENDCSSSEIITITEATGISLDFVLSNYNGYEVSCRQGQDGFIDLNINGGTPPYVINWEGPNNFSSNSEDITNLIAGNYTMFLIDFYGCDASIQFTLSEPQTIQISTDEYPEICGTGGEITTQIYGGVEPVSFSWIGPNSFNSNSSEIFDLESGNYELTINDANNCSSSQEIIIQSIEGPNSDFSASSYEFMLSNEPTEFYDNSTADLNYNVQIVSWEWDFGDGGTSNEQNPSYLYNEPGLYYVWLTVTDENDCEHSTMRTINVQEEYFSYSPNAFSPNGDGVNDTFSPVLTDIDYYTYEIMIFNRWGDVVFKSDDYNVSWDGTFKGEKLSQGLYTYKMTYKTRRGIDKQEKGEIVLIK